MNEAQVTAEILEVCRVMHAKNLLAAADGNVSCRVGDDRVLVTPSGINKAFLRADEMAVIDLHNTVLAGNPSSECRIHTQIYRSCPAARYVIHAHPVHAIAWTVARPELEELPAGAMSEIIIGVGRIPVVPYARATTDAVADGMAPYLPEHRAMILARHGAVAWGEDLAEALNGIERIENSAQILKLAQDLGGITCLPEPELEALCRIRAKKGIRNY